jgi:hypothetical protein
LKNPVVTIKKKAIEWCDKILRVLMLGTFHSDRCQLMQQRMRGFVICNLLYNKGIIDRADKSQLSHYNVNM